MMRANRPVFVANDNVPFFTVNNIDFIWNEGTEKSQKQKNFRAMHEAFFDDFIALYEGTY